MHFIYSWPQQHRAECAARAWSCAGTAQAAEEEGRREAAHGRTASEARPTAHQTGDDRVMIYLFIIIIYLLSILLVIMVLKPV